MVNLYRLLLLAALLCLGAGKISAQQEAIELKDISYQVVNKDAYAQERCLLDVYIPAGKKDFVTIVWCHGGGLTGGAKEIPAYLKGKGVAIVGVGYRFAPKVTVDEIIQDAALSVKWVFDHIEEYGGNTSKIVLSGHSAGGYLAMMLGLNKTYLQEHGIDADKLYGLVPFSGQAISHFTHREAQGIGVNQPTIDAAAPLYWVRKASFPITLITGDRELEMVGRYEENAYLARMLKIVGNERLKLMEIDGYGHDMVYPALPILLREIQEWEK